MPTSVLTVLIAVTAFYVLHMGAVAFGYARIRRGEPPPSPETWPSVTVIVPARNEVNEIDACLDSLNACTYPEEKLEIIVVDDFSTDGTAERVRRQQPAGTPPQDKNPVRLVDMASTTDENGGHKPAAVARGVEAATGDVILTTDADCTVPPTWIQSMVRWCTKNTPFVAGPVAYNHNDLFLPRLQSLELMGLVGYGAGSIGLGLPTFCNSANIAVRRELLETENTPPFGAAQDELLLQDVAYDSAREVAFNPDPDALVRTAPAPSFTTYIEQQARWAHMGLRYPYVLPRLMVVSLWCTHAVLFLTCAVAIFLPAWRQPAIVAFLGKMAADALVAAPSARRYDDGRLLRSSVPTELLLLLAVPVVGVLGTLGVVEWKGRLLE